MSGTTGNPRSPIAIVGIGCRFQGVRDVDELWSLLIDGRVAMREIPADRFDLERYYDPIPGRRGRIVTREGGYLDRVWDFDNTLFRMSHREAGAMDPQHRVLLEVGYQALQDAGVALATIDGARAGVYIGMFTSDFRDRMLRQPELDLSVYVEIGTTRSSAAGRLSHAFNLTGPASTVDAACASSLVAIHQACQAIWLGEVPFALAGGANLVLEPEAMICFSQSGMLAPDSRCKFGDASADGFVRSEGAALVVLKPLDAALRDGDRVYAVIRGSGVANDGRQGTGLYMTPSVEGQRALLQTVYDEFDLDRNELVYMEAHGTGTKVGDPVETKAIADAISLLRTRPEPLWIGSIKTNLGHTEGAAGVAGLIRAALVLHHREIPPSLHLRTPNPEIPWEAARLQIPTARVALPAAGELMAGVSAFGLSGTNAHVALATGPAPARTSTALARPWAFPLSAHTPQALRERAASLAGWLTRHDGPPLVDACATARRLSVHDHRALAIGDDAEELASALSAIEQGADAVPATPGKVAFVFPGQGGQFPEMGRALRARSPEFRAALERIDAAFRATRGWSPIALLDDPQSAWADDIRRVQPVLVAVQIAIAEMWIAMGLRPDVVVGHSMGEVAAAAVCGALSLEDAIHVICARSELLATIAGKGAMAVLGLAEDTALAAIRPAEGRVVVAVVNAPRATVVAGDPESVDGIVAELSAQGTFARRVNVDVASHSPQTEPLLPELRRELAGLAPRAPSIPMISTVDAALVTAPLDAEYWARNLRSTVRFAAAVRALSALGATRFVECNPHPVLTGPITETARASGAAATVVASMHRDDPTDATRRDALATLYAAGVPLDLDRFQPAGQVVSFPPFPFQRETFALPTETAGETPLSPSRTRGGATGKGHPWLSRPLRLATDPTARVWQIPLSVKDAPWLADHVVRGSALLPGAAFVEVALAVARMELGEEAVLEDVELLDYLVVPETKPILLQVQLQVNGDAAEVRFHTFDEGGALRLHASARALRHDPRHRDADPEHAQALLAERIHTEHARSLRSPAHAYGLLQVRFARDDEAAELPVHRIRRSLRPSDQVFGVAQGEIVVVAQVTALDQLAVVAQRLLGVLQAADRTGPAPPAVTFRGAILAGARAVPATALAALAAGLPPIVANDRPLAVEPIAGARLYADMAKRGIHYGPAFRAVQQIRAGSGTSTADLDLGPLRDELVRRPLHPAFLDACFQAAVAGFLGEADARDGFLPVGIHGLRTFDAHSERPRCIAWNRGRPRGRDDELLVDLLIVDEGGRPIAAVDGLRVRRFAHRADEPRDARIARWTHHWRWDPIPAGGGPARHVVVVGGEPALGARLGAATWLDGDAPAEVARALDALPPGPRTLVYDAARPGPGASPLDAAARASARLLDVLRAVSERRRPDPVRLWVLTRGAWAVALPTEPVDPAASALWGLVRVLANEAAEFEPRLVDLDEAALGSPRLGEWVGADLDVDELALRGEQAWAHRLVQGLPERTGAGARPVDGDEPIVVSLDGRGGEAAIRRGARPRPRVGEARIRVEAGVFARVTPEVTVLGIAGVVDALGPAVEGIRPGDRVLAFVAGDGHGVEARQVARNTCVRADRLARVGARLAATEVVELAAHWLPAMLAVEGLCAGERLFVAGAEAPIAQAAAWLAHQRGVTVVASAPTLEARAAVRGCGLGFVLEAGAPDLALVATDLAGGPFHRVLDLAGDLGGRADGLLAEDGVLVHGRATRAGSTAVDLHARLTAGPRGRLVAGMRTLLTGPHRMPALWGVHDALAPAGERAETPWASAAVDFARVPLRGDALGPGPAHFDPAATYVITGGTGGLGLRLAAWLARHGAGHLVLASRSGQVRAEDAAAFEALATCGAVVEVETVDVADLGAVEALIARAGRAAPVRGVFHLAGLLNDATWERQDEARFRSVMAPKVAGAWNLHRATRELPLDTFVLFASAAATVGSPGQANYAAANAFLDGLAHLRRAEGLPATSLAWGSWSETGLAAAESIRGARLERNGMSPMSPAEALDALSDVLGFPDTPEITVADIDWRAWADHQPAVGKKASLRGLVPARDAATEAPPSDLAAATAEQRPVVVARALREMISRVTRLPAARVEDTRSLAALGLDSLMAVELRTAVLQTFGVEVSPRRLLGMASLVELGAAILLGWAPAAKVEEVPARSSATERLDQRIVPSPGQARPLAVRRVLLTGATGFVGAQLLRALLDRTDAVVACLVRPDQGASGVERIMDHLQQQDLDRVGDAERIVAVHGDLAQPRFGLTSEAWEQLANGIDAIYHCGAWVNHAYDYATLAPANVDGTAEVLRLAAAGVHKAVHHVSTVAVFPFTTQLDRREPITEDTPLADRWEPFFGAYAESKWAAERLCEEAMARGLDVTVYRLGLVTGDRVTATNPSTDAVWRIVHAIATLGRLPRFGKGLALTPVDFVAGALVELSLQEDVAGRRFHLFDRRPTSGRQLAVLLARFGFPVFEVERAEWLAAVRAGTDRQAPIGPLVPRIAALDLDALDRATITMENGATLARLSAEVRALSTVDEGLLGAYLRRLVQGGFLRPARATATPAPARHSRTATVPPA